MDGIERLMWMSLGAFGAASLIGTGVERQTVFFGALIVGAFAALWLAYDSKKVRKVPEGSGS